jgi:N-hydroxyarylamine O-acetyltransferase
MGDLMTAGEFDLAAYLARIGWAGPLGPDLDTLRRLVACHTATIPFEGIDALLGRTPALEAAGLQAKLVGAQRGGWCFEQNSLLAMALAAIGFRPQALLARVRYGVPPGQPMPRTHMVLRLDLVEGLHLADVGFGSVTLTAPLALRPGAIQATPHGPFRVVEAAGGLLLQAALGGAAATDPARDWVDLYLVGPEPQLPVDVDQANWLVANRPGGFFTANLVASRSPPGRRIALLNRRLTVREADGTETVTRLDGQVLGEALRQHFGIALPGATLAAVDATLAEQRTGHDAG